MNPNQPSLQPLHIPTLLRKYDLRPRKSLGQNFLIDQAALGKIVAAAGLVPGEVVLEVGPGLGSLTRLLAQEAHRVVAVELDQNLIPPLQDVLAPFDNVRIIHGDILDMDLQAILSGSLGLPSDQPYAVVSNIPYYITSALIRHMLEASLVPNRIILTIQREVAQRICASPPGMSLLALGVQVYGEPKTVAKIPAGAFYPAPKIDSAVVRVDVYPTPRIPPPYTKPFFQLAKAGFSQKRKNLRNALSGGLGAPKAQVVALLEAVNIDPRRRAETLSLEEWRSITTHFYDQPDCLTSV